MAVAEHTYGTFPGLKNTFVFHQDVLRQVPTSGTSSMVLGVHWCRLCVCELRADCPARVSMCEMCMCGVYPSLVLVVLVVVHAGG